MSSSSPVSPPDLSSLSISSQLERSNDNSISLNDLAAHPSQSAAFFSTAPPSSAPFGQNGAFGTGSQSQAPAASYDPAHFNNTIASMGSKSRGGLPSHWLDQPQAQAQDGRSMSPPTDISSSGSPPPGGFNQQQPMNGLGGIPPGGEDDDIIPTAIVIKNIPFSVKRETLLEIIASLSIPTPYAFNYHVDAAGAFRGLAFANFRLPADADAVVAALNGFDVQGRKLRVEYKKVLQAGEKERIEREKAIRRMRSMQLEKERQQAQQQQGSGEWEDYGQPLNHHPNQNPYGGVGPGHNLGGMPPSPARSYPNGQLTPHQMPQPNLPSVPPVPQIPQQYYQQQQQQQQQAQQYGQRQTPLLHVTTPPPMPDLGSLDQYHQRSFSPPSVTSTSPPPMVQRGYQQQDSHPQSMVMPEPAASPQPKNYAELDMNDASTLEIYSRILLFKDDRMRDELAFSRSLTAMERRVVHMVAKKLGLYHRSVGEGAERYAVVMRFPPDNNRPPPPPRQQSQHTLSRAQSSYLSGSTGPSQSSPNRAVSGNGTSVGGSSSLRAKKSMPDLSSLHAPNARLSTRASNGNIREGYATISGASRRQHNGFNGLFNGDAPPPVPTLPPSIDGAGSGGLGQSTGPGGVVRQPRGPGGGEGFGTRRVSEMNQSRFGKSTNTAPQASVNEHGGLNTQTHEPFEI